MDKAVSQFRELSFRARRALMLMLVALVVVAGTSIYYLRPKPVLEPAAQAAVKHPPVLRDGLAMYYAFVSSAMGWGVEVTTSRDSEAGSYWVFKTVDAGRHWQKQLSGKTGSTGLTLGSLQFLDARTGYVAAGDPLSLYRTSNGGSSWTRLELAFPDPMYWVQFVDASHGWMLTRPHGVEIAPMSLFVTPDGGKTWNRLPDAPADQAFFPVFRNLSEGWSGASFQPTAFVYATNDGGITWEKRPMPVEAGPPGAVSTSAWIPPRVGIVLVYEYTQNIDSTVVYTTADGGGSWVAVNPVDPGGMQSMGFVDSDHWWAVQGGALYKTADRGRSWTQVAPAPPNLNLYQVIDSRHAWAALDEGFGAELVLTSDGGVHWTPTNVPVA